MKWSRTYCGSLRRELHGCACVGGTFLCVHFQRGLE